MSDHPSANTFVIDSTVLQQSISPSSDTLPLYSPPSTVLTLGGALISNGENQRSQDRWSDEVGPIYLQTEHCLYKIHSWFLMRDSPVFRAMLGYLSGRPSDGSGFSEERPLHINAVSEAEIESLLAYYYDAEPRNYDLTTWIHLLNVADGFCFRALRAAAIAAVDRLKDGPEGLSPIDKLHLAVKFKIASWYKPAYEEIVKANSPLSPEDAARLSVDMVMLLTRTRESYYHHENFVREDGGDGQDDMGLTTVRSVDQILSEEMTRLRIDITGARLTW